MIKEVIIYVVYLCIGLDWIGLDWIMYVLCCVVYLCMSMSIWRLVTVVFCCLLLSFVVFCCLLSFCCISTSSGVE